MKKYISILTLLLSFSALQAQEASDAFRYTQDNTNGTARFRAMGGAFGALGGDLSAINVNPAGTVVFANHQVAVTGNIFSIINKSNYFNTNTSNKFNSIDLNQAGAAFVFEKKSGNWKKIAVAINYEKTNSFDNSLRSAGINNNSIDKYFLSYAQGVQLNIIEGNNYDFSELTYQEQQAYLAYQAYIIDPVNSSATNINYTTNVPLGNFFQTNLTENSGYNAKVTFNAATQYKDILMLGININTHFTDYHSTNSFSETNSNTKNPNPKRNIDKVWFNNDIYTYGSGFSFQLGAILKPIKQIRLGLSYQSPTWYKLNDELTQNISTAGYGLDAGNPPNTNIYTPKLINNPNLTVIYPAYNLQTPSKFTGSFAYVFGKKGLLSFDYSLRNYSNTSFKPKNDIYFQTINSSLSKNSNAHASEFRVGGEYKIKQISLRGGYRFEQSPYKNASTIGNLTSYSGGVGYNFGNKKLDLAYSNSKQEYNQQFFSQGMTDAAKINATKNNITLTFVLEL